MNWFRYILVGGLVVACMSFTQIGEKERKKWRIQDFNFIQQTLELKYAPRSWKEEYLHLSFDQIFQQSLREISQSPMSTQEYQQALRRMLHCLADYHVGISFYSTEAASLPFTVKSVNTLLGRRYFIASIEKQSPLRLCVGDEILSWDGRPMEDIIHELKLEGAVDNQPDTEQSLAEKVLTRRLGLEGVVVPQGKVMLAVRSKNSLQVYTIQVPWTYTPNKIPEMNSLYPIRAMSTGKKQHEGDVLRQFLNKKMMWPIHQKTTIGGSPHEMGRRESFLPRLGSVQWSTTNIERFDAYITQLSSGKRVGFIRIPEFIGDLQDVATFRDLISLFNQTTDYLIIDQLNNPGGELFYLYGILQALADRPLTIPTQTIALTQEEVFMAVRVAAFLETIHSDQQAYEELAPYLSGYQADLAFVQDLKLFLGQLLSCWEGGALCTDPLPIMGISTISPFSPSSGYHHPILLLINELDFSCADLFPAVLQDNQRAILMGKCTAGAGGYVCSVAYPNRNGIGEFCFTGSLVRRVSGLPIENLGVEPNIVYDLTEEDVCAGYTDYAQQIIYVIEHIL